MSSAVARNLAFLSLMLAGTAPALAASRIVSSAALVDAMVVPGNVPAAAAAARPAHALYNEPAAAPVVQARGNYGGGFIEFLMSGDAPAQMPPAVLYNNPQPRPHAATPSRDYVAYSAPQAASLAAYEPRRTVDPQFLRIEVEYSSQEKTGTIVIDTASKHLYLVAGQGRAIRYGIGVGRPGFMWAGVKSVSRKAEWPDWTPPAEMLLRRPDLPRHMAGGPENPLGARALYLGSSLYRIHGTNEPYTIGQNVSSGCIRMMNDDVVDLYGRVGVGTKVIVM
jgi:lipoprotein-anchoring transpeptidase ErfK/SrfK